MNAPRVRWMVLAFVGRLYLALKAARLEPVEALRVGTCRRRFLCRLRIYAAPDTHRQARPRRS